MRVNVDLTALSGLGSISKKQVNDIAHQVVVACTNETYSEISRQAGKGLHGTRNTYLAGLQMPKFGRMNGSITLIGDLPNMIEQGAKAYDMKEGFSRSKKIKKTKSRVVYKNGRAMVKEAGWYLTIPMRMATPSALGESEAFAGKMSKEAYEIIKEQKAQITVPIFGVVRRGEQSKGFGVTTTRDRVKGLGRARNKPYTSKSGEMEGIIKTRKFYEKASQSSYVKFRRVGSGSDENAFIHKGFEAKDFFKKAIETLNGGIYNELKNAVVMRALGEIGLS